MASRTAIRDSQAPNAPRRATWPASGRRSRTPPGRRPRPRRGRPGPGCTPRRPPCLRARRARGRPGGRRRAPRRRRRGHRARRARGPWLRRWSRAISPGWRSRVRDQRVPAGAGAGSAHHDRPSRREPPRVTGVTIDRAVRLSRPTRDRRGRRPRRGRSRRNRRPAWPDELPWPEVPPWSSLASSFGRGRRRRSRSRRGRVRRGRPSLAVVMRAWSRVLRRPSRSARPSRSGSAVSVGSAGLGRFGRLGRLGGLGRLRGLGRGRSAVGSRWRPRRSVGAPSRRRRPPARRGRTSAHGAGRREGRRRRGRGRRPRRGRPIERRVGWSNACRGISRAGGRDRAGGAASPSRGSGRERFQRARRPSSLDPGFRVRRDQPWASSSVTVNGPRAAASSGSAELSLSPTSTIAAASGWTCVTRDALHVVDRHGLDRRAVAVELVIGQAVDEQARPSAPATGPGGLEAEREHADEEVAARRSSASVTGVLADPVELARGTR